jgi:hypothetical protein
MALESLFDPNWNPAEDFTLPGDQPEERPMCPYAQKYEEWTRPLLEKIADDKSLVTCNQYKVLLVDKYFEWRSVVPKAHRFRVSETGHRCIFHVFEDAYATLKAVELGITPPMLFVPPPPLPAAAPSLPSIAGIFLGELDKP